MDADVSWPANTKVCVHKEPASEGTQPETATAKACLDLVAQLPLRCLPPVCWVDVVHDAVDDVGPRLHNWRQHSWRKLNSAHTSRPHRLLPRLPPLPAFLQQLCHERGTMKLVR